MSTRFSSVVGYHLNALTCGVAKFNAELALQLGVPFVSHARPATWGDYPMLSLKWSELPIPEQQRVSVNVSGRVCAKQPYAVFWHDAGHAPISAFAAASVSGVDDLWCPPARLPRVQPAAVQLFSLGMAHKLTGLDYYRKVRALVEATGHSFNLRVSVAIHEGHSLDAATERFAELTEALGPENVQVLGCLTDYAVAEELARCHAVCAFFPEGVRPNNTSVHLAMQAGCPVITNLDARSPRAFVHGITVIDLAQTELWPGLHQLRAVGRAGHEMSLERYAWAPFLQQLEAKLCAPSLLPTA